MKSNNTINSEFFVDNRARLRKVFPGKAPIILTGNYLIQKSADSPYPFVQDSNFWYLTGINEPGITFVIDNDKEYIILPIHNKNRESFDGAIDVHELKKRSGVDLVYENDEGWKILGKKISKVKHIATISPSSEYIEPLLMFTSPARKKLIEKIKSYNEHLDFIDLKIHLLNLREVKQIKQAVNDTAKLYKYLQKTLHKTNHEADFMTQASIFITKNKLEFAYEPIIAGGQNANVIHYSKNNSHFNDNDLILFDVATKYNNYCADITRTVSKNPSKRQVAVYQAVLDVQEFAIGLLKPGVLLSDYEEKVREFMGEKLRELGLIKIIDVDSVREYYPYLTSHFLGIDPHDAGDHDLPLEPGMVLTVEPGIHIKDESIGIRLEDIVLITKTGNQVLSSKIVKDIAKLG
jgi:Xaa-Pro aminopeptidase